VTSARLAWHLTPLSDEYDTITVSTPSASAGRYGATCVARSSASSQSALPWSRPNDLTALPIPPMSNLPVPSAVPPSATQCFAQAAIGRPHRWMPRTSAALSRPHSAGSSEKLS